MAGRPQRRARMRANHDEAVSGLVVACRRDARPKVLEACDIALVWGESHPAGVRLLGRTGPDEAKCLLGTLPSLLRHPSAQGSDEERVAIPSFLGTGVIWFPNGNGLWTLSTASLGAWAEAMSMMRGHGSSADMFNEFLDHAESGEKAWTMVARIP